MAGVEAVCRLCGVRRGSPDTVAALSWVHERDDERPRWLCPPCARVRVRDIEGQLPVELW
jgi:hypothetical protein